MGEFCGLSWASDKRKAERKAAEADRRAGDARRREHAVTRRLADYEREREAEFTRAQSEEAILRRVKQRRPRLIKYYDGQKILLIGKPGCGKSSLINSFNFVINRHVDEDVAYHEVCETSASAITETKTIILNQYGPGHKNMYSSLPVDMRSKCPSFFDVCGIPNRSEVKMHIRSLAEGRVRVGCNLPKYLDTRPEDLTVGARREEMASWVMIFVLSACEPFPVQLAEDVNRAVKELAQDKLDCRLFVLVTMEDKDPGQVQSLTADAIAIFNLEKTRVFSIVNFLHEDRDEDYDMKPVPAKQLKFINVFSQILSPATKPEWAYEED